MSDTIDQMAELGDERRLTEAGVASSLRNCMLLLQQKPKNYKLFGIYWWPVKALLKRAGYTTAQAYMLGDYFDPEVAEMVPKAGVIPTLEAAFREYGFNARFPHADNKVENPDGELVTIFDSDAGL